MVQPYSKMAILEVILYLPTTMGPKKLTHMKKVGRKQNIITFFLLEIGQKFKQV